MSHLFGGLDDRLITRAATEIALQGAFDLGAARVLRGHPQAVERHDEAGCAEAALRAVAIDHRLLHRMQAAVRAFQMLDRQQLAAVQRRQEADAGIDRLVAQPSAIEPADDDGAGAAIALGAAFLAAGTRAVIAQPVEHGQGRVDARQADDLTIQTKTKLGAHNRFS